MALELIGGAAVGAVFGELARACMDVKDKAVMFRPKMDQLEDTIKSLEPVIKEIQFYNHELNRPQSEIESLIGLMEGGKKLLYKCSRIRRWYDVRRVRYQKKLVALDESLLRFLSVDLQAQIARNQMQMLLLFRSIIIGPDHRGHQDLTLDVTVFYRTLPTGRGSRMKLLRGAFFSHIFRQLVGTFKGVKDMATETITITLLLQIKLQSDGPGCWQDFIVQRQIERKEIVELDGGIKHAIWTIPSDLLRLLNQQSEITVSKIKRLMVSSDMREYKYIVEDANIWGGFGVSRVSAYDKIESNIELLAVPTAADETSTANRCSIIRSSSISEDLRYQNSNISSPFDTMITGSRISEYSETEGLALPPAAMRYQNPNNRMITASRNPQQYQRSIMPTSSASDQNSWRILEYDETNENTLCDGRNHSHIERVALPLPSDETSVGKHDKEYEKSATQHGPQIMQRLHVLEGTAGKMKLLTPAVVLLGCFNLVMSFLILMYK